MWCGGQLKLFRGSPSLHPPALSPCCPSLGSGCGSSRTRSGRAGRPGRAPAAAPRPPPRPRPVPSRGRSSASLSPARALRAPAASPRAPPPPRRSPLRLPALGTSRPEPRPPSLARARAAAGRGRVPAPTMRGELWLLVLVLRETARALSPQPGAGRTGRSWPGWARVRREGGQGGRCGMRKYRPAGSVRVCWVGVAPRGDQELWGRWQVDRDPTFLDT